MWGVQGCDSPPAPPAAKEPVQADEALGAAAAGVRAGLEGERCAPRRRSGPRSGAAMQCRGASCSPQDRLTPSPTISPAFLPFSPSRSLCVLVFPPPPLGSLGSGCPSAVPPAPSGAEVSAPPPFGRQHHFCLLERVSGNGVSPTAGPCTPDLLCSAVLLRLGLSVCPPRLCPPCQGRAVWAGGGGRWETHPMGNMEGGGPTPRGPTSR